MLYILCMYIYIYLYLLFNQKVTEVNASLLSNMKIIILFFKNDSAIN